MIRNRIMLAALCGALVAVPSACTGGDATEAPRTRGTQEAGIIAYLVTLERDTQTVEAVGTARASLAATIFPESAGEVRAIEFVSGQFVARGAVLARLDDADERLRVARSEVALQDAGQLLERYERIDVEGAISESQIDAARTAVNAAQIDLELAREALAERTIRAPFAGHVGLSDVDPGARITAQTEITRLDDRRRLFVDFEAPEQVFGLIAEGDLINMVPFAAAQGHVEARVLTIGNRIDPQRRFFTVRAEVDNSEDALRPGMSFRINFELPGNLYPSVPEASIVWGGDGAYLWAVREGRAERVSVNIVSRREGNVLVDAPLVEGDRIVSEGVQKVRQGQEVRDVGELGLRAAETAQRASSGSGAAAVQ